MTDADRQGHAEETTKPPAVAGETRRLQTDSSAADEELREFMARMHGKSPQEALGAVAESRLTRGIVISTIGALMIIFVFTLGPYLLNRLSADTAPAPTTEPERAGAQAEPNSTEAAGEEQPGEPQSTLEEAGLEKADLEKASEAMGIGETKTADPNENPLDRELDSLLDGAK